MSAPSERAPVALVTGAGRGIGRSLALRLAADGADVAVVDLDADAASAVRDEIVATGRRAIPVVADVSRADDCDKAVRAAVDELGALDVTVVNAGIVQVKPFLEITAEDWDRMMGVNLRGAFLTVQAAARTMLEQQPLTPGRPRGKIVLMSSIAGRYGAGEMAPLTPHYRASKAAVISLGQTAAVAFAPHLTVNTVCPGLVGTPMWEQIDREWSASAGWAEGEAWRRRTSSVPMGRPQTADDVADLVSFLAGPGSDYITGQAVNSDGGLSFG
ncbi:SDR family oxidoreductase [Pseudonocardia alni]|uniref:SDR family oxidoreductase n=1 Tax=Pseudonocardia alni TaxID=33907 RepID=UPI00331FA141